MRRVAVVGMRSAVAQLTRWHERGAANGHIFLWCENASTQTAAVLFILFLNGNFDFLTMFTVMVGGAEMSTASDTVPICSTLGCLIEWSFSENDETTFADMHFENCKKFDLLHNGNIYF